MKTFYIETLGCSKNQVDSEKMIYHLTENGYLSTDDPNNAEIIIINTCGFIKKAKEEAIETIFEMSKYKESGKCKKLIVAGCLAEIYSKELKSDMPEIDTIFGIGDISKVLDIIDGKEKIIIPKISNDSLIKRKILSYPGSAYLKISDGCSNFCSYCLIPVIRGNLRSRKIDDILKEVEFLKNNNVKEIIIISQDTANYGIDAYGKKMLGSLVKDISNVLDKDDWIRILYMHPDHLDEDILNELKSLSNFIPYFDIPFQSGSDEILKAMNRKKSSSENKNLIKKIREIFPESVIRSSFITGFPNESDDDFNDTINFIREIEIDWIGGFTYSQEKNTNAGIMKNQIKEKLKKSRLDELMKVSENITKEKLKRFLNSKQKILVEEKVENESLFIGRFWGQAPEVDGLTVLESSNAKPGTFSEAEIKKLNEKDFYAL